MSALRIGVSRPAGSALVPLICWSFCCLCSPPAQAAPGDLDLSFAGFGQEGKAYHFGDPMSSNAERGMAVQPDGKIVVAGCTGGDMLVMRFLADGGIDPSFGDGGVFTRSDSWPLRVTSVALQADGKVVVAGWRDLGDYAPTDFLVSRLTASGHVDPSFNGGGIAYADFDEGSDVAYSVLVQPDGKIVVAGTAHQGTDYDFGVARYNSDGSPDNTFGGDGKRAFGFGDNFPNSLEACYDLALQSDGKLVLVGGPTGYPGGTAYVEDGTFKIARLNGSDGSLDGSFAVGGKFNWDSGSVDVAARCVSIDADGRIVVAGYDTWSDPGESSVRAEAYVIRILPNGSFDNGFDGNGRLRIDGVSGGLNDVAVQPDGRIVLLGWHTSPDLDVKFVLYRLNVDGSADSSFFPPNGFVEPDLGSTDVGYSLALLADGRILAYGATGNSHALVRLWPDGMFDAGGKQAIGFTTPGFGPGSNEVGYALAVQADGKMIVAGTVNTMANSTGDFGLARLMPDGELDTTFGVQGRAVFAFDQSEVATCMALQSDGKIVVGGYTGDGGDLDFMVVRFNADGTVDGSFGFLGFRVFDFLGGSDYCYALAIGSDGKIVMAGTVFNGARNVFGVARLSASGSLDTTFDSDGMKLVEFSIGPNHWATAVLVQPDLKIVEGGHVGADFATLRLNVNGSLDATYGSSGKSIVDMGGNDYLQALALASNGSIYGAGTSDGGGAQRMAAMHLQPNGVLATCQLNCSQWWTGKAFVALGSNAAAYALDLRSDNKLVMAGVGDGTMSWAQLSTTSMFPSALTGSAAFPGNGGAALAVRFAGANKLVAAGYFQFNDDRNMALARFETTIDPSTVDVADNPGGGVPPALRLHPVFPNPLRGRATIAFDLSQASSVRLALYDVAGRLVRTLVDEPLGAGEHEGMWDGKDEAGRTVAAGFYLVRLDAGAERSRQSIVVLK